MDIIRPYKSNKNMTETERIEHLKQLNRARRNRHYRKKKMEQLRLKKLQEPTFTIQKMDWCDDSMEEDIDSDEEDAKSLIELYRYIAQEPDDQEILEAIDILEEKLGIYGSKKLNTYIDSGESSESSDSND